MSGVSIIDKNSLAWIGWAAISDHYGISDEKRDSWWTSKSDPKLVSGWEAASAAISEEAIRRYKAAEWPAEKPVLKVDILAITRDLSR